VTITGTRRRRRYPEADLAHSPTTNARSANPTASTLGRLTQVTSTSRETTPADTTGRAMSTDPRRLHRAVAQNMCRPESLTMKVL